MSVLPKIHDAQRVGRLIDSWRQSLTHAIQPTAQPLLTPRNTRVQPLPGQHIVRCQWDPGSQSVDGYDISWSDRPDFQISQSRRLHDPKALLAEIPVDTTKEWMYFRVRAFIGTPPRVSRWSPIQKAKVAGTLAPPVVPPPVPGKLSFAVRLQDYGIIEIDQIALDGSVADIEELHFDLVSVDETDTQFYATGFPPGTIADPLTFNAALNGQSRRGELFTKGRFVLLADFDPAGGTYKHEIFQITNISGVQWTVQRHGPTDPPGQARFGTAIQPHADNLKMYPLELRRYEYKVGPNAVEETPPATLSGLPDRLLALLPSHCVIAVKGAAKNRFTYGNWRTVSLIPSPGDTVQMPPAPGLRTENGAQYTMVLDGDLSVGQTMAQWIPVSQWATIRDVWAHVRSAPSGADLIIAVLFIEPLGKLGYTARTAALLDTITIPDGKNYSYNPLDLAGPPDGRNTPYRGTWPFSNLPTVGLLGSLFDASGNYIGPLPPVAGGSTIPFAQDGHLVPVVVQVGSTAPGSNADIVVRT
jgi:hypothetical protein